MHEFNSCQAIVDTVLEQIRRHPNPSARAVKATVVLGHLRQIVAGHMQSAYETLTKDTRAQGSVLEIKHIPAAFICDKCGKRSETHEARFKCPSCGSRRGQVDGGRELYLESIEMEEEDGQV
jgi:hydrogenase nickel incorporation protein HypA/HybF